MTQEQAESTEQTTDPAIEQRAKLQGWRPKDEFKGNPDLWRPAEDWVKRADEMTPIMKATNKKLEDDLLSTQEELRGVKETLTNMTRVQEKYATDSYDQKVSDIRAQKIVAVDAGETAKFLELEEQEKRLAKPEAVEATEETIHPVAQRFFSENAEWWDKDASMTRYAQALGNEMVQNKDPRAKVGNEAEFFKAIKEDMQATFPHKFMNPNREISTVDEPNTRGSESIHPGPKGWNDLDGEAQEHCNMMCGPTDKGGIPGMTKEKYIKAYFEVD